MTIHAYSDCLLERAMDGLGAVFDLAFRQHHLDPGLFTRSFLDSYVSHTVSLGSMRFLDGISARESLGIIMGSDVPQLERIDVLSAEYWAGCSLAYIQWYLNRPFDEVLACISVSDLIDQFGYLGGEDRSKVIEFARERMHLPGGLAHWRRKAGLTQERLALLSDVSVRNIRAYEQGQNELSRAQADVVWRLARVLGCTMEDLLS